MKYFILTLFVLNAFSFSLNDDWDGMEEVIKVKQDAVLDLVDQLDVYSDTPITQQIENQVQQLISPPVEIDQTEKKEDEQNEVHSLEYWLDRLGDEYQDETILLQQSQTITEQITTVLDNLIMRVEDDNQIVEQTEIDPTIIIDGINLDYQDQNINENIQMEQFFNSALELQESLSQDDEQQLTDFNSNQMKEPFNSNDSTIQDDSVKTEINKSSQQLNDNSENTLEVQIDSNNEEYSKESIFKFTPNEYNRMFNQLNDIQKDSQDHIQSQQQVKQAYNFKEYSFNKEGGDQRSLYNDNEHSTLKVVEREQPKEINNNLYEQQSENEKRSYKFINKDESELHKGKESTLKNQDQPQEISVLKQYLLYTDQPEVISTGITEKEIEEDRKLINAFKSMNREEHWEKTNQKQKINSDVRDELIKLSEEPKQKESEFQEIIENKEDNPHKFISFKSDPKLEKVDNVKKEENVKSKYDELPETKLQSKEDMQREKEQKIQEMQKIIEEQLKNKTLKKQSETDKSLLYESEYLQWERATQTKSYPEINFVMTQNNLRKRL